MAGQAKSEEGDAFDDVTPAKPVSVDDLDYDGEMPTRAQSSDEIAEYQRQTREKREAAFRSFRPPTERTSSPAGTSSPDLMAAPPSGTDSGARKLPDVPARDSGSFDGGSGSMPRPIPRESGPQRIDRLRSAPPREVDLEQESDLEKVVEDVAATLEKLPPAPRVPKIEPARTSLERIPTVESVPPAADEEPAPRSQIGIAMFALVAIAIFVGLTFFR